jgi:hypothetical protein
MPRLRGSDNGNGNGSGRSNGNKIKFTQSKIKIKPHSGSGVTAVQNEDGEAAGLAARTYVNGPLGLSNISPLAAKNKPVAAATAAFKDNNDENLIKSFLESNRNRDGMPIQLNSFLFNFPTPALIN